MTTCSVFISFMMRFPKKWYHGWMLLKDDPKRNILGRLGKDGRKMGRDILSGILEGPCVWLLCVIVTKHP